MKEILLNFGVTTIIFILVYLYISKTVSNKIKSLKNYTYLTKEYFVEEEKSVFKIAYRTNDGQTIDGGALLKNYSPFFSSYQKELLSFETTNKTRCDQYVLEFSNSVKNLSPSLFLRVFSNIRK